MSIVHYFTARIDIKNVGKYDNKIEVLDNSDENSSISSPNWFKQDDGIGTTIYSFKGNLNLKIKCINDGKLNIRLRGINIISKNDEKIPIFIKYTNFCINNEQILTESKIVSHDRFYQCNEINVKNGEIIKIYIEWIPFNINSINLNLSDNFLIGNDTTTKHNLIKSKDDNKIVWCDINNSKPVDDYTVYYNQPGTITTVRNYKEIIAFNKEPNVVRVFSHVYNSDLEILIEIKVTDYANIGLSSSEDVIKFSFLRINNKDWLFYKFTHFNNIVTAQVSKNGIEWENIELTKSLINGEPFQFQISLGYSDSIDKRVMFRNIKIYKIQK